MHHRVRSGPKRTAKIPTNAAPFQKWHATYKTITYNQVDEGVFDVSDPISELVAGGS